MIFGADAAANEKVLCDVSKYERTAFAIDVDALSASAIRRRRTGAEVVYG